MPKIKSTAALAAPKASAPADAAAAPPSGAAPDTAAPATVDRTADPDAPDADSPQSLHGVVAAAAHAALASGRFSDHAALHSIEAALGDARNRLVEAKRVLGPEYADLIEQLQSFI